MLKLLGVVVLVFVVLFASNIPMTVYVAQALVSVNDQYQISVLPEFLLSRVPAHRLVLSPQTSSVRAHKYSFFGVDSIYFNLNVTAFNVNGTVFLEGYFYLDSLAEQKIELIRSYDRTAQTKDIHVVVDAYLRVTLEDSPDIERDYHGEWDLTLP